MAGLKNKQTNKKQQQQTVIYTNISPKMVNSRDMLGNAEEAPQLSYSSDFKYISIRVTVPPSLICDVYISHAAYELA